MILIGILHNAAGAPSIIQVSGTGVTLSAPALVTASGTAFQRPATITLDWSDVSGATSYTLEYAGNAGFTGSTTVAGIGTSQYSLPALVDGTYYWRVKAVGAGGESSYSSASIFGVIPTFEEWTVILLASAMIAYGVWYQRRRARA